MKKILKEFTIGFVAAFICIQFAMAISMGMGNYLNIGFLVVPRFFITIFLFPLFGLFSTSGILLFLLLLALIFFQFKFLKFSHVKYAVFLDVVLLFLYGMWNVSRSGVLSI